MIDADAIFSTIDTVVADLRISFPDRDRGEDENDQGRRAHHRPGEVKLL